MRKISIHLIQIILILLPFNTLFSQSGWQVLSLSPGNPDLNSVYAFSPNNCLAVSGYTDNISMNYFKTYRSTNGGLIWDTVNTINNYFITTIKFINAETGFGGGGWSKITSLEPDAGFAVFKTINGGVNWTFIYGVGGPPLPYNPVTDMHFLNSNTGWVCTLTGNILRTTNGGGNFYSSYTSKLYYKYGINFIDAQTGWIVGDSGYVSNTVNGGVNWTIPIKITTSSLRSVYFVNFSTGYISGDSGRIFKTINGGINWNLTSTGINSRFNKIFFYNLQNGWTAGNGVIYATTNGGDNWYQQAFSPSTNINSIFFTDSLNGWMCGGKKIFKTLSGGWTKINLLSNKIPNEFSLFQNYPNPFNSITNIRFNIKTSENIKIYVFDITGKNIITLINNIIEPGEYEIIWNPQELPSGIYLYKMETKKLSFSRRMIIIR